MWPKDCVYGESETDMGMAKKVAVLIAERDADLGGWMHTLRGQSDQVVVVQQQDDESFPELATRVRERVATLGPRTEVVAATLAGGPRWDVAVLGARSLMVRAVVSEMVAGGRGRLFLDATKRQARISMQALASVVEEQIVDTGVTVRTDRPAAPIAPARRRAA